MLRNSGFGSLRTDAHGEDGAAAPLKMLPSKRERESGRAVILLTVIFRQH